MNERQYFQQFSGEPMANTMGGALVTGQVYVVGGGNHEWGELLTDPSRWFIYQSPLGSPFVDDNGNPPPHYLYGDIIPEWHYGRWWICNEDLVKAKKAHGD